MYENVNGLLARLSGNVKLDKIKIILDDLHADIFAMNEHRNNFNPNDIRRYGLHQLFYGVEAMIKGIVSFNKHKTVNSTRRPWREGWVWLPMERWPASKTRVNQGQM